MYILKTSDGQHTQIGTSTGNRQNEADGTFWITGWTQAVQGAVDAGGSYYLSDANGGNFMPVEVVQIGGAGMGGIRFSLNT
jgi:hypothetical protein